VMNMVQDFASSRLATVIQAVLDGPKEHSSYDSIIEESVYELQQYAPGPADADGTSALQTACSIPSLVPGCPWSVLHDAH
jgi:hypothetical protein